jgi:hypothetical protein
MMSAFFSSFSLFFITKKGKPPVQEACQLLLWA